MSPKGFHLRSALLLENSSVPFFGFVLFCFAPVCFIPSVTFSYVILTLHTIVRVVVSMPYSLLEESHLFP